jgi:hypothetical protein
MGMKEEFEKLVEKLKIERDEIKLKVHLASMDAKEEFEAAEKKWDQVKAKASEIAGDAMETSDFSSTVERHFQLHSIRNALILQCLLLGMLKAVVPTEFIYILT